MTHQRRYQNAVPLRTVTNGSSEGTYSPTWTPVRPGAQDHEKIPSRMADGRHYRDGRIVLTENDLAEQALGTGAKGAA